jgi:hypothetical protein
MLLKRQKNLVLDKLKLKHPNKIGRTTKLNTYIEKKLEEHFWLLFFLIILLFFFKLFFRDVLGYYFFFKLFFFKEMKQLNLGLKTMIIKKKLNILDIYNLKIVKN